MNAETNFSRVLAVELLCQWLKQSVEVKGVVFFFFFSSA